MGKSRKNKKIVLIVLLLLVVGLSIGFADFTRTLSIQSSSANVSIAASDEDFYIVFSSTPDKIENGKPMFSGDATENTDSSNPITLEGNTIKNLSATLSARGQKATWTFYARNEGNYEAYLKSVIFNNVENEDAFIVGTKNEGTTQSYVDRAVENLKLTVTSGTDSYDSKTGSKTDINDATPIAIDGYETITVTLEYLSTDSEGNPSFLADGDFTVEIGNINLGYSSVQ